MRGNINRTGRACVIGAGNGGQAAAAHLGSLGWEVSICETDEKKVAALRKAGRIRVVGKIEGSVKPRIVTSNSGEAIDGAEFIIVTTTANSHYKVGREFAPYIRGGEIFLIMPGYFCGALVLTNGLKDGGNKKDVIVCDSESLYYACRAQKPGNAEVTGIKPKMRVSAFPAVKSEEAIRTIRKVFTKVELAGDILETSFNNVNPMFHPPITLLNTGWVEKTGGNFIFYPDGCTTSVARAIEQLDRERLGLAAKIGVQAESCMQILRRWYGSKGKTLYEAIMATKPYYYAKGPDSLNARYISEDIPMGLIPYASLASRYESEADTTRAFINIACTVTGVDYWKKARTIEALRLNKFTAKGLKDFVRFGK